MVKMEGVIYHASDWHGQWSKLPVADLYIFTGDMLPNFPLIYFRGYATNQDIPWRANHNLIGRPTTDKPSGMYAGRKVSPEYELECQKIWCELNLTDARDRYLGNPDAPVIIVRGNHDWENIGQYFGGDLFEVNDDPSRVYEYKGLRVGGMRGINSIRGEWNDEIDTAEQIRRAGLLPDGLDILVTHAPAKGMLDFHRGENLGMGPLGGWLIKQDMGGKAPRLHCFGHIHEAAGTKKSGATLFSNAATTQNRIELADITS